MVNAREGKETWLAYLEVVVNDNSDSDICYCTQHICTHGERTKETKLARAGILVFESD